MPKVEKSVACYVRVSTVGQNESGQKVEITRWLNGNGIDAKAVRWYVDKKSGDNLERPAFAKMQEDIFAGAGGIGCRRQPLVRSQARRASGSDSARFDERSPKCLRGWISRGDCIGSPSLVLSIGNVDSGMFCGSPSEWIRGFRNLRAVASVHADLTARFSTYRRR